MATRGIVKAPGVNLLLPDDPSRRLRTLDAGAEVSVLDGVQWLRVEVGGVTGLVPAAAVELEVPLDVSGAFAATRDVRRAAGVGREAEGRGSALRPFTGGARFRGEPILAHVDFHPALRRLDGYAALADAEIHVTHSFRRRDARSDGGVVPPPKRSNHLVGHAIDMNIVVAGAWLNSERLRPERFRELPANARYLIQQIREDPELRWGGDFLRPDPVHVDDNLYRRDPAGWERKLREV